MEIQPQLTMLQKTLLNVEGLGRELNPDLDLWKTAHPFLEKWLKEQLGVKKILKSIKNDIPKWMRILENLPDYVKLKEKNISLTNSIYENKLNFKLIKRKNYYLKLLITLIFLLLACQILFIIL